MDGVDWTDAVDSSVAAQEDTGAAESRNPELETPYSELFLDCRKLTISFNSFEFRMLE